MFSLAVSTAFLPDCTASYDVTAMCLDAGGLDRAFSFLLEVCMKGGLFFSNILDDECLASSLRNSFFKCVHSIKK